MENIRFNSGNNGGGIVLYVIKKRTLKIYFLEIMFLQEVKFLNYQQQ